MADWFEMSQGGLGKKFGEHAIGFTRKANQAVVVSLVRLGDGPGKLIVVNYEFTPDEWREVERALQIAK